MTYRDTSNDVWGSHCFFVGHHERSVMCRLIMRGLGMLVPRLIWPTGCYVYSWFVLCFRRASWAERNVPFDDAGWECHYFLQISASCLVSSDLRDVMCIVGLYCVFVGHHERSVMCRLTTLVGIKWCWFFVGHHERSVMCRLIMRVGNARASSHLTYGWLV